MEASLDPPNVDRVHHLGRRLVNGLYMVAKTVGMYEAENVVAREALTTFMQCLEDSLRTEDQIRLQMASDCLFVNDTRLRVDFEGFVSFRFIVEAMKLRGLGSLVIRRDIRNEEFLEFLRLFHEHAKAGKQAFERIRDGLRDRGIGSVEVGEYWDLAESPGTVEEPENLREVSINTYFRSIYVAKQFMQGFRRGRVAAFRKARRVVHTIVDLIAEDDSTLLALTQIKNFDSFLFTHSANVCVLSVALGQGIGLEKELLGKLGLAALLHDLGMMEMPKQILGRRTRLSPEEREIYERHPAAGARTILRTQGVSEISTRCALVAIEHHLHADGSGFPRLSRPHAPGLLGRIVAVTDFYDTVTTPAGRESMPFTPEEALRLMLHGGKDIFDPALVKVFVNTIGTYPLGTMVLLDTGEVGVVHRRSPRPKELSRPLVKITMDPTGNPVPPQVVDLNERDPETGLHVRSIVEAMPPAEHFTDVQDFTVLL